jgi:hypothetical protein
MSFAAMLVMPKIESETERKQREHNEYVARRQKECKEARDSMIQRIVRCCGENVGYTDYAICLMDDKKQSIATVPYCIDFNYTTKEYKMSLGPYGDKAHYGGGGMRDLNVVKIADRAMERLNSIVAENKRVAEQKRKQAEAIATRDAVRTQYGISEWSEVLKNVSSTHLALRVVGPVEDIKKLMDLALELGISLK